MSVLKDCMKVFHFMRLGTDSAISIGEVKIPNLIFQILFCIPFNISAISYTIFCFQNYSDFKIIAVPCCLCLGMISGEIIYISYITNKFPLEKLLAALQAIVDWRKYDFFNYKPITIFSLRHRVCLQNIVLYLIHHKTSFT